MKTVRTFTAKRLAEFKLLSGMQGEVSIYQGDLKVLLAVRAEIERLRARGSERRDELEKAGAAEMTSSAKVKLSPDQLRALLDEYRELDALMDLHAGKPTKERLIQVREGEGRRLVLVGPEHGGQRPNVRTYGFDTAQLTAHLGLHPETVRRMIRDGELVPSDLGSIHALKLRVDAKAQKDAP